MGALSCRCQSDDAADAATVAVVVPESGHERPEEVDLSGISNSEDGRWNGSDSRSQDDSVDPGGLQKGGGWASQRNRQPLLFCRKNQGSKARICVCGNTLMPDSNFCRSCGSKWIGEEMTLRPLDEVEDKRPPEVFEQVYVNENTSQEAMIKAHANGQPMGSPLAHPPSGQAPTWWPASPPAKAGLKAGAMNAPTWEVVWSDGVRVRSMPVASGQELKIHKFGAIVKAWQKGDWVELADEPGFMRIAANGIDLIKKTS